MAVCNTDSMGDPELRIVAAKFSALKNLCIKNCSISDAGVEAMAFGCPNLIKLKVKRCRGVTQASVCQLRFQRRSLIVLMDDAGALPLEDEEIVAADSHRTSSSIMTHIVCSSRSASLIKSKLGTALQRRKSVTII
ncbi:hypothetical protein GIB67_009382 [Kingdonia uniflora]|uniref:Uncharacterized protein n=1 Tax=Kingdonia uniflora TaxID=39325 RepID=A0A7J7N2Z7_9MAGN|nr:hypothetical protein GIB67_009382 [Kingdonia uniflora]